MSQASSIFRKPPKLVLWLLVGLLCIWVIQAVSLNWTDASPALFVLLRGDSDAVLHGQVWRLLTAALLHDHGHPSHVVGSLLLLYFFLPTLLERWGARRLLSFLAASAAFAFGVETLMYALAPTVASPLWFGATVLGDAAVVAWAVTARNQQIRLFFVLPMRAMTVVGLMIAWHVLLLIARGSGPEGMFAPFAAMGAGYLFGETSPLRRILLRYKLQRLRSEVDGLTRKRSGKKGSAPHLRVISGGAKHDDDDDDGMLH